MATPDDGYPPDAPTRLVGDGRVAVRVPVAWPMTTAWGRVTESCVRTPSGLMIPAVGFKGPKKGTLAVHLSAGWYSPPEPDDWPILDVEGGQVFRVDHRGPVPFDFRDRPRRQTSIRIMSMDRTGSIRLEGNRALARTVAATAHVLPPELTVVPHPFVGRAPGKYRRDPLAEVVAARMELAGLVAVVRRTKRRSRSESCTPRWGEVVPVGTEVEVVVTKDDERRRRPF